VVEAISELSSLTIFVDPWIMAVQVARAASLRSCTVRRPISETSDFSMRIAISPSDIITKKGLHEGSETTPIGSRNQISPDYEVESEV
jgi:hypothetical protein